MTAPRPHLGTSGMVSPVVRPMALHYAMLSHQRLPRLCWRLEAAHFAQQEARATRAASMAEGARIDEICPQKLPWTQQRSLLTCRRKDSFDGEKHAQMKPSGQ